MRLPDATIETLTLNRRQDAAGHHKTRVALRHLCLVLMALTACHSAESGRTSIDPALAALVPPDATMLAGIRMEAVCATPLYKKMLAQNRLQQLDDFAHETGFDPRRDVRELLIASNGKDSIVTARGTFNLRAFGGVTKSSYKGYTLFTRDRGGVALIDSSTAIAGSLPAVRATLDRQKAGAHGAPVELLARARQIPAEYQIWSVSSGFASLAAGIPMEGNAANLGRILQSLENANLAADLRTGLNGYIDGLCRSDQDAKSLGDAARGLVGLGRLSVPENQPELLRLWDGIKVDQQQRTVKITVAIPQDLIDKLMDTLQKQSGRRGMPVSLAAPNRQQAASSEPEWHRQE